MNDHCVPKFFKVSLTFGYPSPSLACQRILWTVPYFCLILYSGVTEMYCAPRSAIHSELFELLDVDIRPPAPLALSQMVKLTLLKNIQK